MTRVQTSAIATACLVTLVVACTTIGTKFDMDKLHALSPGVSTEQDAIAALGAPNNTAHGANGRTILSWHYGQGTALGTGSGAHASILFETNGVMIRIVQEGSTTIR